MTAWISSNIQYTLVFLTAFLTLGSCIPKPAARFSACETGASYYAHPSDCNAYYQCVGIEGVLIKCAAGLHWNTANSACDYPDNAHCVLEVDRIDNADGSDSGDSSKSSGDSSTSEESVPGSDSSSSESNECPDDAKPPTCPAEDPALSVFFPHPDPRWFYHCSNGDAFCKVCPADLVWNTKCDTCDWPDLNGCVESDSGDSSKSSGDASTSEESVPGSDSSSSESAPPPPPPPPPPAPESDSGDSSKSSGDSSTSEESVPGSDSSSSESIECPDDAKPPTCPAEDPALSVFFPHPDPQWFYHCSNGVSFCKVCPPNLVWNTKCDTCDWPDLNGCVESDSGDSSKSSGDSSTSEESVPGSDSSSSE